MLKKTLYWVIGICVGAILLGGCGKEQKENEANPLEKEGYVLDWHDEFDGTELDTEKWLPQYLPHNTSSAEGCMTKYTMEDGVLKLIIDEDSVDYYTGQKNRADGGFLVSSIQTYEKTGLHMKDVQTTVAPYTGYVTQYGYFELRCKIPACGGGGLVAWWMVGTEYDAQDNGQGTEQCGEIDILETLFEGANVHTPKVHTWDDPDLFEWQEEVVLEGDSSDYTDEWHTYAMDWTPEQLIFYVDGQEVARTEQSPQYDMCMLLSLYTSTDPAYWGGGAASDVYPKVWEIDYVRVYKDENGYPNAQTKPKEPVNSGFEPVDSEVYTSMEDPAVELGINDRARLATMTSTAEFASEDPGIINRAGFDATNGCCTVDNPVFPAEYTFTWDSPQDVDMVNLYSYYAKGQAPTEIELQVQKEDGEWTTAAGYEITWKLSTATPEYARLPVPDGEGITGLKLIVMDANMQWNHYVIQKIHIYKEGEAASENPGGETGSTAGQPITAEMYTGSGDPAVDFGINDVARQASLTSTAKLVFPEALGVINSAGYSLENGCCTIDDPALPDEYTFTWDSPQNVDMVNLYSYYSTGQAPTKIELQVQKEGGEWTTAGSYDITWNLETATNEYAKMAVSGGDNITALKVIVKDANLKWKHYVIQKIHIYKQ